MAVGQAELGRLSDSVSKLRDTYEDRPVTRAEVINNLLRSHPNYGAGRAEKIRLPEDIDSIGQPLDAWLEEIRSLYRNEKVLLDGRRVILGFGLLYPNIYRQLQSGDFFNTLIDEIDPSYDSLLSAAGKERLDGIATTATAAAPASDEVGQEEAPDSGDVSPEQGGTADDTDTVDGTPPGGGYQSDRTRLQMDNFAVVDRLGRQAYATTLGLQIRYLRHEKIDQPDIEDREANKLEDRDQALLLHLYGPWGSGKSSLLYFLQQHMEKALPDEENEGVNTNPWIVVNFNAWQHQRSDPPWWFLMDEVYHQSRSRLWNTKRKREAVALTFREQKWRFGVSFGPRILSFLIALGLFILVLAVLSFVWVELVPEEAQIAFGGDLAAMLPVLITIFLVIGGSALVITRQLLPTTTESSQYFAGMSRSPITRLSSHFTKMIKEWMPAPVVVMIDDLDRCDKEYVTKLLENIQTLFRKAPVVYVVAADKEWLTRSYEEIFDSYSDSVGRPGIPLGYLFLDKIFQLSAPVPGMQEYYKKQYLDNMLREDSQAGIMSDERAIDRLHTKAAEEMAQASLDREIEEMILGQPENSLARMVYQAEGMKRQVSPEVRRSTEHRLKKYEDLLGDNPRTMKRMINTHLVQKQLVTMTGANVSLDDLPLWAILVTRWPAFATYLGQHSEALEYFTNPAAMPDDMPEDLKSLFDNDDVKAVINGDGITEASINSREKIEHCARLSS